MKIERERKKQVKLIHLMKEQERWRVNIKRKTEKRENESPNGKQQTTLPNPFCLLVTFPFRFVWLSSLYFFQFVCVCV